MGWVSPIFYDELDLDDTDNNLSVNDTDGNRIKLKHKPPIHGILTLGVPQVPDGNNEDAIKFLREKAEDWSDKVRTRHLPPNEAWLGMPTTIIRLVTWTLPDLILLENKWKNLVAPALNAGLPCSCMYRNVAREVVHGPNDKHGIDIMNLYVQQES